MLQSPDEIATDAVQVLDPNAFYVPSHKILYELIIKLTDEGKPIDAITLQEALIRDCLLYTSPSTRDQRGSRLPSYA